MRAAPTLTEEILWQVLRGSRLGVAFRRQAIIGRCIVDFVAPSIRLVVEFDGGYHTRRPTARGCAAGPGAAACRVSRRACVSGAMVQHRLGDAVALVAAIDASS